MPDYSRVADSGAREDMATGSVRDSRAGKGRYDLIPAEGMRRLARHYENGAEKYDDDNWRKGQPFRRTLDSAIRHLYRYLDGDRTEDHLAAAAWGAFSIMHFEREIAEGRLPASLEDTYRLEPAGMTWGDVAALAGVRALEDAPAVRHDLECLAASCTGECLAAGCSCPPDACRGGSGDCRQMHEPVIAVPA